MIIKFKKGLEGPLWRLITLILLIVFIIFLIVLWPSVAEGARSALKATFDRIGF